MWLTFFPQLHTNPSLSHLQKVGLDRSWYGWFYEAGDLREPQHIHCDAGPDGQPGRICELQGQAAYNLGAGYRPDTQIWKPARRDGETLYWIGWEPAKAPTPNGLLRESSLLQVPQVYNQTLRDGNQWHVPIARGTSTCIPQVAAMDWETGKIIEKPDTGPRTRELTDIAEAVYQWKVEGGAKPSRERLVTWAVKVLQVMYRLDLYLAMGLELFAGHEEFVLWYWIDYPVILQEDEARKKKGTADNGSSSASGGIHTASGKDISPPMDPSGSGPANSSRASDAEAQPEVPAAAV